MNPLGDWYPGYGEVEKIRRMSPLVRNFISRANQENPAFLENYLLPALENHDAEGEILEDIHQALCAIECEDRGLSSYEFRSSWLQNVPMSLGDLSDGTVMKYGAFQKERHQILSEAKKRAQAELAAAKTTHDRALIAREKQEYHQEVKAAKHAFDKEKVDAQEKKALIAQIGKPKEGHHWEFFRDNRTGEMIATQVPNHKSGNFFRKAGSAIKKTVRKYGNVLISVVGIALAPFTGGASLAVAALITLGNGVRQKRIAANKAKREGHHAADKMVAEATQQQAQAGQQMDQFYAQNQKWFVDNLDLTPDKWAQLTFDQKLDILQHGMRGTAPGSAPAGDPGAPAAGGGYGTPGGGGGGGGDPSQQPGVPGSPAGQQIATAGMFDGGMMPILLVGGVALAAVFGKPVKGGSSRRRSRRNPGRRRWRVA